MPDDEDESPELGADSYRAPEDQVVDRTTEIIHAYKKKIGNPISAIRSHCVECMGGSVREIAQCTDWDCSLYQFRMGVNPLHGRSIKAREAKAQQQQEESDES